MAKRKPTLLGWLGLRREPDFSKARWLGRLIGAGVIGVVVIGAGFVGLVLVGLAAFRFLAALTGLDDFADAESQSAAIRNTGLVLAAIIGLPFLVWRSVVAQKQVDVAEQGQLVEQINNAANLLSSSNESVRIAALYSFHALGMHPKADFELVSGVLATHIRKLSALRPIIVFQDLIAEVETGVRSRAHSDITDFDAHTRHKALGEWAKTLPKCDEEFQTAITLFGRLPRNEKLRPDFKGCNFQNVFFSGLDYSGSNFNGAWFDGAKFEDTRFTNCTFAGSQYRNTYSSGNIPPKLFVWNAAQIFAATFYRTTFENCDLSGAVFDSSIFLDTEFRESNCSGASFLSASLRNLKFSGCLLYNTFFFQAKEFTHELFRNCVLNSPVGISLEESQLKAGNTLFVSGFLEDHEGALKRWRQE